MRARSLRLCSILALFLIASLSPTVVLPRGDAPNGVSATATIVVNTMTDEWSTNTSTMAQSLCSLREALQAASGFSGMGNQGCGNVPVAAAYNLIMVGGTYLLTIPQELPHISTKVTIDGPPVTIDGNGHAGRTNGIFIVGGGELHLKKVTLQRGKRPFGGAIWIKGSGIVSVTDSMFVANTAFNGTGIGDGGAVAVDSGSFYCYKSKFWNNQSEGSGGAISSGGVKVDINDCEFRYNKAALKGGAYAGFAGSETTHPTIRNSLFQDNKVYQTTVPATWPAQYAFTDDDSGGGAIYNKGYMELINTQLVKNSTMRSKGGAAIYNQGELWMLDVAISKNKATPDEDTVPNTLGGAILNHGTLVARRSSIHSNEASYGGGIMNPQGGTLYVVNSTVADNQAKVGGGISNGFNFVYNSTTFFNNGGTANVWQSTVVRANDETAEPANVENPGNSYFYIANSIVDSPCTGVLSSHGGNIFKEPCQRVPADWNNDQTATDVIVQSVDEIGLQGLDNNGGASLPEAEFLSVMINDNSPAVDLAQSDFCDHPSIQTSYLAARDQLQGQRPNGTKCDSGAIELGSQPPKWYSDDPFDDPQNGFIQFPMTVFGVKWSSNHSFFFQNKGGGMIKWEVVVENDGGGVFSLLSGPTSGGLAANKSQTLIFRCTPTTLGTHEGMLLFKTDLPDQPEIHYPISCFMKRNPSDPAAWPDKPPGPLSTGPATPGGQSSTQLQLSNQSPSPMAASVQWQNPALADTLKASMVMADTPEVSTAQGIMSSSQTLTDVTIPPSSTLKIDIACTPAEPGLFADTLQIKTNDPTNPLLSYDVSCESAPAPLPERLSLSSLSSEGTPKLIMGLALSPQGNQLLAGHWEDAGIAVYSIPNQTSGLPILQTTFSVAGMSTISGIRYSSDGKHVYYTSSTGDGIVTASRDASGNLAHVQTLKRTSTYLCGLNPIKYCSYNTMDGARALDISPDDRHLYVTGINDDSLTVLRRNTTSGMLSVTQRITSTLEGGTLIDGPFGVLVSSDGKNVYVAAANSDTLFAFRRGSDGKLAYLTHHTDQLGGATGLNRPIEIAESPDGKFLYVASYDDNAVQIFERNPADGFIKPVQSLLVGGGPYHLITSQGPEGDRLLVALLTGDQVRVYARNRGTGKLSLIPGQATLTANGPAFLVTTPDDQRVYASLYDGRGVALLRSQKHPPLLQTLSPSAVTVGGGDFTLIVNGSHFYPSSTILWNGTALATTFVSERQLRAVVPAAKISSIGPTQIKVRTGAPGGGDSNALAVGIRQAGSAPEPSVHTINPPEATLSGMPLDVQLLGAGFTPQSQALLNSRPVETTYLNGTTLQVRLENTAATGPLVFTVQNGAPATGADQLSVSATGESTPLKFTVEEENAPALAALSHFKPGSLAAGSPETWLTLIGANFSTLSSGPSVAYWNGAPRETVVVDKQTLKLRLSAADLATAGQRSVRVFTPGAGMSDPKSFAVLPLGQNPVADLEVVTHGSKAQLIVSGNDFVSGATVQINGITRPTTFVNAHVLIVSLNYNMLRQGGLVRVANPSTGVSNELVFMPRSFVFLPTLMR